MNARPRIVRNGSCFLLGASWVAPHPAFPRLVHVYLGPWLITFGKAAK